MRPVRWVQRHLVPILAVVAVAALFLSTFSVIQYTAAQADRERERLAYDRAACQRGNALRAQIVAIGMAVVAVGTADRQMIRDLIDQLIGMRAVTPEGETAYAELLARLEPSFDKQEGAVDEVKLLVNEITLTNCPQALDEARNGQ